MSRMLRDEEPHRVETWTAMEQWLTISFDALDPGDVLEIGPAGFVLVDEESDEEVVPCAQVRALRGGLLEIRLSRRSMEAPSESEPDLGGREPDMWHPAPEGSDCTEGSLVTADLHLLASTCTTWFRDRHELEIHDLGCEHHAAGES